MTTDAFFLARFGKYLIRQLKVNSAHMDNDATGCYGCIIVSLGMIACRCLGMPPSAIQSQAESLRLTRYAIKHAYGISEKTSTKERSLNHSSVRAKEVDRLLSSGLDLSCLYSMRSTEWPRKITSLASSLRIFSMRLLLHGILVLL